MTAALMQTQNLQAFYGSTRVLHGIDFALEPGGITTILGANGAGKTTALRAISGMVRTEGAIQFDGERIDGTARPRMSRGAGIAHVPDGRGTIMQLTVEENLKLGAHTRKDKKGVAEDTDLVFGYFPRLKERAQAAGRHAVRRRAADAGDQPRADDAAEAAAAGRAELRPCAA